VVSKKHFNGKVFVITNKSTASTAEIFALALKENKLATVVGQTTMGAALSGKKFKLDEEISIFIPQGDYISYAGYRIDKKGVKPDIEVKNEDEVQYILKNLVENN
jgi:carboxyl-terminal processing protease